MRVHGLAVQQERLLGQGHEFHGPFLNPDVPTPECVEWLLTTSIFLTDVMLFTNPRFHFSMLTSQSFHFVSKGVPSFPSFLTKGFLHF